MSSAADQRAERDVSVSEQGPVMSGNALQDRLSILQRLQGKQARCIGVLRTELDLVTEDVAGMAAVLSECFQALIAKQDEAGDQDFTPIIEALQADDRIQQKIKAIVRILAALETRCLDADKGEALEPVVAEAIPIEDMRRRILAVLG